MITYFCSTCDIGWYGSDHHCRHFPLEICHRHEILALWLIRVCVLHAFCDAVCLHIITCLTSTVCIRWNITMCITLDQPSPTISGGNARADAWGTRQVQVLFSTSCHFNILWILHHKSVDSFKFPFFIWPRRSQLVDYLLKDTDLLHVKLHLLMLAYIF